MERPESKLPPQQICAAPIGCSEGWPECIFEDLVGKFKEIRVEISKKNQENKMLILGGSNTVSVHDTIDRDG